MDGNERDSYARHQAANAKREERIRRIAELNDRFRAGHGEQTMTFTPGMRAMGPIAMLLCIREMRLFKFPPGDDECPEHDFGSFDFGGQTVFFKLDYYDISMEYGSPDPSNPEVTRRVITFMLASEY